MIPDIIHVIKNMVIKEGEKFERLPDIKITEEERQRIREEWRQSLRNLNLYF